MTQKNTIRTEVVGNDANRYLLKIEKIRFRAVALIVQFLLFRTESDTSSNCSIQSYTKYNNSK